MTLDLTLIARVLLTLVTAGYALATILADFNATHATNPKWTPHARFHVVWQILSYAGLGLLAFGLIWWPGALAYERLCLVAAMAVIVYGAFFTALFSMKLYGGGAYDDNGYQPFEAPVAVVAPRWDVNVTVFCVQVTMLTISIVSLTFA